MIKSRPARICGFFGQGIPVLLDEAMPRMRAVLEQYADLPADFADASPVASCERIKVWDVASADGDFTIYRGRDKRRFNNLFSDV